MVKEREETSSTVFQEDDKLLTSITHVPNDDKLYIRYLYAIQLRLRYIPNEEKLPTLLSRNATTSPTSEITVNYRFQYDTTYCFQPTSAPTINYFRAIRCVQNYDKLRAWIGRNATASMIRPSRQ